MKSVARVQLAVVCLFLVPASLAAEEEGDFDPLHHTADGYYLDFEPIATVELPRIFFVRGAEGTFGLKVYASTAAALRSGVFIAGSHEDAAAEGDHGAVSVEDLIATGAHLDALLVPNSGEIVIDFSMTRHLIFALLGAAIVLFIFLRLSFRYQQGIGRQTAPRGLFQNLFETLILFVRDSVAKSSLGERYKPFLPFLLTIFFFILTCNLMGLVPFGATATSNLMVTSVLATFTFVLTQVNGSKDHWRHIFWPPGIPVVIKFLLIPTEIMGQFTKPIALAIRLFANMTAGHLVILSLVGLIFTFSQLFGPLAGYGVAPVSIGFLLFVNLLEILIAFIQAYIFTFLSALFIGMAIAEHPHDAHAHA